MYSRFLAESAKLTENEKLLKPSEKFRKSGELFSATGQMFVDAERADNLKERIHQASSNFSKIHDIEAEALKELSEFIIKPA
jgi:hypothetical protein